MSPWRLLCGWLCVGVFGVESSLPVSNRPVCGKSGWGIFPCWHKWRRVRTWRCLPRCSSIFGSSPFSCSWWCGLRRGGCLCCGVFYPLLRSGLISCKLSGISEPLRNVGSKSPWVGMFPLFIPRLDRYPRVVSEWWGRKPLVWPPCGSPRTPLKLWCSLSWGPPLLRASPKLQPFSPSQRTVLEEVGGLRWGFAISAKEVDAVWWVCVECQ